jgi:hypothetical protein
MSLAENQIRSALLRDDEEVRCTAVSWYSEGFSRDPTVMPVVLESVNRFGLAESWRIMHEAQWLPQTAETIDTMIAALGSAGDPADAREENFRFATSLAICRAPVELIASRTAQIDRLPSFPLVLWKPLEERVRLKDADWEEAIAALVRLAEKTYRSRRWNRIDCLRAYGIVELLARYADSRGAAVIALLERRKNHKLVEWLEPFIIRLAGMMRLTAAIPLLLDRLESDELTRSNHVALALVIALARMGDEAIGPLAGRWARSNPHGERSSQQFRLFACAILERVRSDWAAKLLLTRITDHVELPAVRISAGHALLSQFACDAITPIRRLIRETRSEPRGRRLDLYYHLLAACRVMNVSFSKFEDRYQKAVAANWGRGHEVSQARLADEYFEGPWSPETGDA